jgi:hypothetical protein
MTPASKSRVAREQAACTRALWRAAHAGTDGPKESELLAGDSISAGQRACAAIVVALDAQSSSAPDAARRLESLDSLLKTPAAGSYRVAGNIVAARLFEARGDLPRAYAASRRIVFNVGGQQYIATMYEMQGRYAAALGKRDDAVAAFNAYLLLRRDPEPALVSRVAAVRIALDRLTAEEPRR